MGKDTIKTRTGASARGAARRRLLVCACAAWLALPAAASIAAAGGTVTRVSVDAEGVREKAVLALLGSRPGRPFDRKVWERDVARLRDSGWFYQVEEGVTEEAGGVALSLAVRAKWTAIPIFKYKRGGGTTHLTAGAYDVSLGGRLLEAGAQYESLRGRDGFVTWVRHPYLGSPLNKFGAELYDHTASLPLLDKTGAPQAHFYDGEVLTAARLEREVGPAAVLGVEAGWSHNSFRPDNSDPGNAARNAAFLAARPPRSGRTVKLAVKAALGRLRQDGWRTRGSELTLEAETAQKAFGSDFRYWKGTAHWTGAALPRRDLALAAQALLGSKSGREFQHKFFLGGLDTLCGFVDGQFRGEHVWLLNLEARPTLLERPLWALQGAVFVDSGKTWDARSFSLDGFKGKPYLSAGAGVRLALPRVYRAVLRLDAARTMSPVTGWGFNFGVQQFF